MSEHGANLQTFNQELVKCLENLKVKKYEISEIIEKEELDKSILEKNLRCLQDKLTTVNNSLNRNKALKYGYDKAIQDIEQGFKKILESSETLLNLAQKEANKLDDVKRSGNVNKLIDKDYI